MQSEVECRFKREETYVHLWLIHVDIWQKTTQYCKAINLQLKINLKKNNLIAHLLNLRPKFFFFKVQ